MDQAGSPVFSNKKFTDAEAHQVMVTLTHVRICNDDLLRPSAFWGENGKMSEMNSGKSNLTQSSPS